MAAAFFALRNHVQHALSVEVAQHAHVVVTLTETLFVDPEVTQILDLATVKSARDRAIHDAVDLVPRKRCEGLGLDFGADRHQYVDREGLEHSRKTALILGPGNPQLKHSMVGAISAGHVGHDESFPLHGIEVPPAARTRVVARDDCLALGAMKELARGVLDSNGDLSKIGRRDGLDDLHRGYLPRRSQAQEHLIQVNIAHEPDIDPEP